MSHAYAQNWVVFEPRQHRCGPKHEMRGGHRGGWGGNVGYGPGGRGRGPRARRGDFRAAALLLLEEQPRNGYQLMQELEERTDGLWRPSPGSVYPALAQLEDEGLIASTEADGKKLFALTDAGKAHVEEKREQLGTPWDDVSKGATEGVVPLKHAIAGVAEAAIQVLRQGSPGQVERAQKILTDARKQLYRLLGDDEDAGTA
jgi:DNA-binding PadR family transcriptional regulator